MFEGVPDLGLTQVEVTSSPLATHIHYRLDRSQRA
jgi:hypothetical protein